MARDQDRLPDGLSNMFQKIITIGSFAVLMVIAFCARPPLDKPPDDLRLRTNVSQGRTNVFQKILTMANVVVLLVIAFIGGAQLYELDLSRKRFETTTKERAAKMLTPLQKQYEILPQYKRAMDQCQQHGGDITDFACEMADNFRYQIHQLHFEHPDLLTSDIDERK
jgi:hypothetical protein